MSALANRPPIYLIDTSSLFFRAFYAVPPLTTPQGIPSNAVYGFANMILRLIAEKSPQYWAFCMDRPEPSFRAQWYPDYKANRSETPADLVPQLGMLRLWLAALQAPILEAAGFEADDLIGSAVSWAQNQNHPVVIVSGDKDFAQLVTPTVTLLDTMKDETLDAFAVQSKWGVRPEQMCDYLALVGDSSDNIPGAKGIGPKTALKLLSDWHTLDGIYQNLAQVTPASVQNKLTQSEAMVRLSRRLVEISTAAAVPNEIGQYRRLLPDEVNMKALAQEWGFERLLKKFEFGTKPKSLVSDVNMAGAADSISSAHAPDSLAPVNTAVSYGDSALSWRSIPWPDLRSKLFKGSKVWAFARDEHVLLGWDQEWSEVKIKELTEDQEFKARVSQFYGFDIKSLWHQLEWPAQGQVKLDLMLSAYVVGGGGEMDFSAVCRKWLKQEVGWNDDGGVILQAATELSLVFQKERPASHKILADIELPLVPILYAMECTGVCLDSDFLASYAGTLQEELQGIEQKIYSEVGFTFNILSPKQLGEVLFERLGLERGRKTKSGYSTDSEVLSKLAAVAPVCNDILEYREVSKLLSTYVEALPKLVKAMTGRLHTSFRQGLTTTGRLSSYNPNLQNIPIRTARGQKVRQAFVAAPGHCLISADYSQIELRVLAHITGDPGLVSAFQNGLDIHAATASEVFHVPLAQVTPEQRRTAKAVNFGLAYGQGAYGLAETLGIARSEAQQIIRSYFSKFSKVRDYMESTVADAKKRGYVEGLWGRRRDLPEFQSSSGPTRRFAERAAINAPIQGAASDIVKLAMIRVAATVPATMLLQVHDELLLECPKDIVTQNEALLRTAMEGVTQLNVPLVVQVGSGSSWGDAHV